MRLIGLASSVFALVLMFVIAGSGQAACRARSSRDTEGDRNHQEDRRGKNQDGQAIFRYDTFGDEQLWTSVLRMHEPIATVDPATALAVGLKVDVEALPPAVVAALRAGQVDLTSPAVTTELLRLNAVVGVQGKVDQTGQLTSVGVTCALCHSTVDNSLTRGIGKRLDGWANLDLNVGAIVALSPALPDALKAEFRTWGPGKYDPRHHAFDGTNLHLAEQSIAADCDSFDLRTEGGRIRNVYRRWADLLLERLCWRGANGRTRQLYRSAYWSLDHADARPGHVEVARPAGVPADAASAGTAERKLR